MSKKKLILEIKVYIKLFIIIGLIPFFLKENAKVIRHLSLYKNIN